MKATLSCLAGMSAVTAERESAEPALSLSKGEILSGAQRSRRNRLSRLAVPAIILAQSAFLAAQSNPKVDTTALVQAATAQKDPDAVAVLAKLAATSGWTRAAIPQDVVVTGTIMRYQQDSSVSRTFTIKVRGREQYRYSEGGSLRLVANGRAGAIVTADGKAHPIPPHSALSSRGLVLPMTTVLADWNAPEVDIILLGPSSINGEPCTGIQLKPRYPDSDPMARIRRQIAPVVVWISTTRNLIVRADYSRAAIDNASALQPETIFYSDYRNVNGLAVPFQQDILIGEQHILRYQFSSVTFNAGLPDTDFNVAAAMGGAR